jgi:tRNA 2-selenouridine synthase
VARNVAAHLERWVADRPRGWRPLVYCWRGGQRSGALAWFLDQIGFRTQQLAGGYKAFRAVVLQDLQRLPQTLALHVLCGRTGCAKTRLLHALRDAGSQVLDLEALARHRGSVLGALPGRPQPTQKRFDTLLWQALRALDATRPVFVENESRRIGALQLPTSLLECIRGQGRAVEVTLPDEERVALLLEDYAHFTRDAERFCQRLEALVPLCGRDVVRGWQAAARAGEWPQVYADLMRRHYDPLYARSMQRHRHSTSPTLALPLQDRDPAAIARAARQLRLAAGDDGVAAPAAAADAAHPRTDTASIPR